MARIYKKKEYIDKIASLNNTPSDCDFSLFVGSGFSINFGMPNWYGYAVKKLNLMCEKKDIKIDYATKNELSTLDKKHLLTILREFETQDLNNRYEKEIFEVADRDKSKYSEKYSDFIKAFSNINASVITTNYDNVFEKYFNFVNAPIPNKTCGGKVPAGQVIHIHGNISPEVINTRIISTWHDYYDLYSRKIGELEDADYRNVVDNLRYFLGNYFKENEILLVGFGLTEMELLNFIFKNRFDTSPGRESNITALVTKWKASSEEVLFKLYNSLGLNVVFIDIDKNGYDEVMRYLYKIAKKMQRPRIKYKKIEDIL